MDIFLGATALLPWLALSRVTATTKALLPGLDAFEELLDIHRPMRRCQGLRLLNRLASLFLCEHQVLGPRHATQTAGASLPKAPRGTALSALEHPSSHIQALETSRIAAQPTVDSDEFTLSGHFGHLLPQAPHELLVLSSNVHIT